MKLGGREKMMVIAGGVVVALMLFYRFGLSPALERLRTLDRLVAVKEREVHEMKVLSETYLAQKRMMEDVNRTLSQRDQDFAIFSFLEDLANKIGIKTNIMYMKPALAAPGELFRESSVEMRLEGIALQQLTRYLYDIERAPQLLRVRRLHIKPRPANPDLLDVTFQVSTFYLQERTSEQNDERLKRTEAGGVKLARHTYPGEDR
jgi:general secretion pathway protein M